MFVIESDVFSLLQGREGGCRTVVKRWNPSLLLMSEDPGKGR